MALKFMPEDHKKEKDISCMASSASDMSISNADSFRPRACIYARFSSDNQRDESIDAQVRACKAYAEFHGYNIVDIYADYAYSATNDKRPEFQRMIADSGEDIFDIVLVHKLDRFSRNRYDSAQYKNLLQKNRVKLISVIEQFDDSPEGGVMEGIIETFSEYYSRNLAREVQKGMKESAYKCLHLGGKPPLGYNVNPDQTYSINYEESPIIETIFNMFLDGYSYKEIAQKLNNLGYKTRKGKTFTKNSFHDILRNEKYAGVYVFNRSVSKRKDGKRNNHANKSNDEIIRIENGMPAIISQEIFNQAQDRLKRQRHVENKSYAKRVYLLSGKVRCGVCGNLYTGNYRHPFKDKSGREKAAYASYRCSRKKNSIDCNNREIEQTSLDNLVLDWFEQYFFNDSSIKTLVDQMNQYRKDYFESAGKELQRYEKALQDVERKIGNLTAAIAESGSEPQIMEALHGLQAQRVQIQESIILEQKNSKCVSVTEEDLRSALMQFKEYVTTRNIAQCKKFLDDYIDEVIVYPDTVSISFKASFTVPDGQSPTLYLEDELNRLQIPSTRKKRQKKPLD